jgi:hypothetical protein
MKGLSFPSLPFYDLIHGKGRHKRIETISISLQSQSRPWRDFPLAPCLSPTCPPFYPAVVENDGGSLGEGGLPPALRNSTRMEDGLPFFPLQHSTFIIQPVFLLKRSALLFPLNIMVKRRNFNELYMQRHFSI